MKIITLLLLSFLALGQTTIKLYPGKAPGSENWNWEVKEFTPMPNNRMLFNVTEPTLTIYPAAAGKGNGSSIIIAPGGAFHILSIDSEGHDVAKFLSKRGITAFVLTYRVVKSNGPNPFAELMPLMKDFKKLDEINAPVVEMATQDGIEAIKYVKTNASNLGIDPQKMGFMGFSAGGTLTMNVLLSAPQELKPNFIAPIYHYAYAVTGKDMPKASTPAFIAVAADDNLGFAPHSIRLFERWSAAKHPSELHVYENGSHGFGMRKNNTASDNWINDFENWLKIRKFL
ncbi:alpha/beta hydrolase [Aquirufa sp. 5-AUSEE-100C1]